MRKTKQGMTLIELMVVIVVIAILCALLVPLIHKARENARKARCMNNMQQLGIAFQNYYTTWQAFPMSMVLEGSGNTVTSTTGWSAQARILPFLDEGKAYNGMNLSISRKDRANSTVISMTINTFIGPSEIRPEPMKQDFGQTGVINYAVCRGAWDVWSGFNDKRLIRPFAPNLSLQYKDITDGTSNTLFMAEVKARQAASNCRDLKVTVSDCQAREPVGDPYKVAPCYDDHACVTQKQFSFHTDWSDGNVHATGFTTAWTPNRLVLGVGANAGLDLDLCGRKEELGGPTFAAITSRSFHAGGVNTLMGDGSVRWMKTSIQGHIWRWLGTPSCGEPESGYGDAY